MIALTRLGKSFADRTLFEGVSMNLNRGSRYGLVGANGAGKTTLLKILAGDEPSSEGLVSIPKAARVGVLRQDRFLDGAARILDVAMRGDEAAFALLQEREALLAGEHPDPTVAAQLEESLGALDGYTLEARTGAILTGLGIPVASHRMALSTLSGGFQLRVLLAQVLVGGPDVLLLDEPTNHLDILSIRWLEGFLSNYQGCAVVISHDRGFLDRTSTNILDVDYGTVTLYTGNYTAFVAQKDARRAQQERERERAEAEIAQKRSFVERFGAKATKAKQAQSRMKQIERIEVVEVAESNRRAPRFRFVMDRPSGRDVLTVRGVSKSYGEKRVLRGVTLTVRRGEKVAVIGANGLGKSTLLKVCMGVTAPDEGEVVWGHETRPGYFAQDHKDLLLDPDDTPFEVLRGVWGDASQTELRSLLGALLFSGSEVDKPVAMLSGGEAARLVFATILAKRPNVLVLDEPTNHLDIEAIDALVEALAAYEGTVILVSHDRWFVSRLATRVLEVTAEGIRDFPGTYDDYLARAGDDHLDGAAVALRAKEAQRAQKASLTGGAAYAEERRKRSLVASLTTKRDKALAAIAAAEARKAAITARWSDEGFYATATEGEQRALADEEAALGPRLDALMTEWESLEEELTRAQA
jgi:ATPase subunit of ABC transporter with duplicated ATPase domains